MSDLQTYEYCKHCGRVIAWEDWSYIHLDGWANCRSVDKPNELDGNTHCEPDPENKIDPQPSSDDEAWRIPLRGRSAEQVIARGGYPNADTTRVALENGTPLTVSHDLPQESNFDTKEQP